MILRLWSMPRAVGLVASLLGLGVIVTLHVLAPPEVMLLLQRVLMVLFCSFLLIWPHATGARPRTLWTVLSFAAALDVLAILGAETPIEVGPLTLEDLLFVLAYLGYILFLVLLSMRLIGRITVGRVLLDSVAAAVGVTLVLWTAAQLYGQGMSSEAMRLGIYPLLDMVALTLAAHLSVRVRREVPVWPWVVRAAMLQLVTDGALFFAVLTNTPDWVPFIRMGYSVVFFILMLAALHPTVRHLAQAGTDAGRREDPGVRRAWLVVLGVGLAEVSLLMTGSKQPEYLVRSLLIASLILLLFVRLFVSLRDLTRSEAESRHRASHDPLTGLHNRSALLEALQERLAADRRTHSRTALLRFDCDDFHGFNQRFGDRAGDVLLRGVAERLATVVPSEHTLARHGGDEFLVVCTVPDELAAVEQAEELRAMFAAPIRIREHHAEHVSMSVGVAVAPLDRNGDRSEMLAWSDAAIGEAKALGGGCVVLYDEDLDERIRRRAQMSEALRTAMRRDRIRVALQPIYGGPDFAQLKGFEALARWKDPDLGQVPPDQFISLAEEEGMIGDLGHAILRRSLWVFTRLKQDLGIDDLTVSVNVSAAQLHESGFRERVYAALCETGLPPSCLQLEITESLLVGDDGLSVAALESFKAHGIGIALDDFGTGYASLTTLRRLPLTCVKLDRSLVSRLGEDPATPTQVKAILDLVRSLDIPDVVAEGIETDEQARLLARLGCPSGQGWLFGKPMWPKEILAASGRQVWSPTLS